MNCSPVFFNMTRWGLAYGGPGAWTDAMVDAYTATIQAGLVPPPAPALLSRRKATAASTGLEWIPPGIAGGCGVVGNLFAAPVGSQGGAAANNGRTNYTQFRCVMTSPNGFPPAPHPYFAIIDSNAAHHLSALLAERAFVGVPAGWAKLIVNFDAHQDFGAQYTLASFRCDNWGIFTTRNPAAGRPRQALRLSCPWDCRCEPRNGTSAANGKPSRSNRRCSEK